MRCRIVGLAAAAALLACLLAATKPAAAQQARSRQSGSDAPFVADAAAVADLEASGFLTPEDAKEAETFDFGDDSDGNATDASGSQDGSSNGSAGKGGTIASGVNRLKNQGTAISAYQPEPIASSGAVELACGFGWVDPYFQGAYIGVGSGAFSKGFSCGRCVKIQCEDAFCSEPGKSVVAQVVDLCGDCYDYDIAMAIPAWQNLTGKDPRNNPQVEISWDYVDCAPFINGTIKMLIKPGGNAYFQAFNFANSIIPITAVQLNGDRLRHSTNHFWEWNPGKAINPRGPFQLALLGANKQVLRATFRELRSQDLKVQFKAVSASE